MSELLSVIVPVYNVEPYLQRCLESICTQTYQALEIICVNDGSTDNSAKILDDFAKRDSRIRIIYQQNQGLAAARNTGLEAATGKWVTGVDSDDYLETDIYAQAMQFTEGHDLVCFDILRVNNEGEPIRPMHEPIAYNQTITDKSKLFQINAVSFWNKLWRKDLIDHAGLIFPVGMIFEDRAFYYKYLAIAKSAIFIPFTGYNYVLREGSIMAEINSKASKVNDYIRISGDVYHFYLKHNLLNEYKDAMLWIWKINYDNAEHVLAGAALNEYKKATRKALQELAGPADFLRTGMKDLLHISSGWQKLFYTRTAQTRTYRFFFIPIVSIKQSIPFQQGGTSLYAYFAFKLLGINLLKMRRSDGRFSIKILGIPVYKNKQAG